MWFFFTMFNPHSVMTDVVVLVASHFHADHLADIAGLMRSLLQLQVQNS